MSTVQDMPRKLKALESLYRIHGRVTASFDSACHAGCLVCCTRNVTLTHLEAAYLLNHLDAVARQGALSRITKHCHLKRLVPKITINGMADMCMRGDDLPDEDSDPAWGPCPLLENDLCTVYEFRPFACRCMTSRQHCGQSGFADMDEFLVTVNNVFMQYLEHLDQQSVTANLSDLLPALDSETPEDILNLQNPMALKNQPLTVLMVPPEHRERIRPIIAELQTI